MNRQLRMWKKLGRGGRNSSDTHLVSGWTRGDQWRRGKANPNAKSSFFSSVFDATSCKKRSWQKSHRSQISIKLKKATTIVRNNLSIMGHLNAEAVELVPCGSNSLL